MAATPRFRACIRANRISIEKENKFVHPALEARAAGSSHRIADEHEEHLQAIGDLEEDVRVVEATDGFARETAIARLHQHFGLFIAGNFEHMHFEETAHNAALWAHYGDAELLAIRRQLEQARACARGAASIGAISVCLGRFDLDAALAASDVTREISPS